MKIAIVGNRENWTYEEVKKILKENNVYKSDVIISGGADGVDTFARKYAKSIGAKMVEFFPDPERESPKRYYERNMKIAMECEVLMAFDKKKGRSGTGQTYRMAKESGRYVMLFDGEKDGKEEK